MGHQKDNSPLKKKKNRLSNQSLWLSYIYVVEEEKLPATLLGSMASLRIKLTEDRLGGRGEVEEGMGGYMRWTKT